MEDPTENYQLNEPLLKRIDELEGKINKILEIVSSEAFSNLLASDTPTLPEKELLSIEDVERDFGISSHRQRVARKCPYNQLEYVMLGTGIRYRKAQITSWLDRQSVAIE